VSVYIDVRAPIVSTNAAYRKTAHAFYMTAAGKAFKAAVQKAAQEAMRGCFPMSGPIVVLLDFWFKTTANDIDGPVKLVLDALQGIVYLNDRQVVSLSVAKHKAESERFVGLGMTVRQFEGGSAE
jgi:Holliday junction resolvase RusA-like endonuclease